MNFLKIILCGIIGSIVFTFFIQVFGIWIGMSIFKGDTYELSYHMFTRMGIIALCGINIACTIIIVKKINEINELLINHKHSQKGGDKNNSAM